MPIMMNEESPENVKTKEKSVKSYASKVFKESSVSAVSAIVSTGSIKRKIFRALIFVVFTAGFVYQCIKFLSYVYTYPTVVSVEIRKPDFYMTPAYTFCNYNKIKRSKFCGKYPDRCIAPNTEFCEKYPVYCKKNDTKVPKEKYYLNIFKFEEEEVLELGHDLNDLLKNNNSLKEAPEGPFIRFRGHDTDVGLSACFSYLGRVNSQLNPHLAKGNKWWKDPDQSFTFDAEEDEVFNPNSQAGVLFILHSQFDAVNPFWEGIFLKPGYFYVIIIRMYEEKLLQYPYKTDCVNYTEKWVKNNKEGPRSQEMCKQLCLTDAYVQCLNCTSEEIDYPSNKKICVGVDQHPVKNCQYADFNAVDTVLKECLNGCKDECVKLKYDYQYQERKILPMWDNGSITEESRFSKVYIEIEDSEIFSFEYKPQYQEVEAFSYIGGFVGIWLGVSLVQVADFFESAFRIIRYFFRKGTTTCSRRSCCT